MAIRFGPTGTQTFTEIAQQKRTAAARAKRAAKSKATFNVAPKFKAVAKPKAKAVKKGPTARQKLQARINKKQAAQRKRIAKEGKALESEFKAFRTGLEPLDVLRKRLGIELGIPELQAQLEPLRVRSLEIEGLIERLPENIRSVAGRESKAFRDLLSASKGADISRELTANARAQELFAGQITGARGELTERLGLTVEQRDFDLRAFGQQADLLNTRLAREIEGYTIELQREFEAGIGDIQRAEQLRDDKIQRLFEIAKIELSARLAAKNIGLSASLAGGAKSKTSAQAESTFKSQISGIKARTPSGTGNVFTQFAASALLEGGNLQNIFDIWAKFSGFGPAKETPDVIIAAAKGIAAKSGSSGFTDEQIAQIIADSK